MSVDAVSCGVQIQMTQGAQRPSGPPPGGAKPSGPPPGGGGEDMLKEVTSDLDEETQDELMDTVAEMRESGASFEEVKSYIDGVLEENGLEPPQPPQPGEDNTGFFVNTEA